MVDELTQNNELKTAENLDSNTLYTSFIGDKGGSSTKLLLQLLNTNNLTTHSNRYAKMIGIYEGDKETRECIEAVFGSLVNEIQETCKNIQSFHLKTYKVCPKRFNVNRSSEECLLVPGASQCPPQITKLDKNNVYVSKDCNLCKRTSTSDFKYPSSLEKENVCGCEFSDCILVLGGDWMWIAVVLGYTGPKGVHLCKDRLFTLSALQKGMTHTPLSTIKKQGIYTRDT